MDDVRAVMDAAGSSRASLFGFSEGGAMSILFAATYPERTSALILYGAYAREAWAPDYPWGVTAENCEARIVRRRETWGTGQTFASFAPSQSDNAALIEWWATTERASASPGAVEALMRMNFQIDVRHILPAISVPTLVMHRKGDPVQPFEDGRYLATHIPGAKWVELEGTDHGPAQGNSAAILDEMEEFLTGMRRGTDVERVLSTVLFTDIVNATGSAVTLGDARWRDLLEMHNTAMREELARHRGREIDTAGDGFLAAFDGPARAIRTAAAMRDRAKRIGLEVRAGLHTGECEVIGEKLAGIAVHIGARVAALAGPGEILVSQTVKDLVAGSGVTFADRGTHALKGVPDEWRIYAVTGL
jgi:class 3 adenylate cyclase